MTSPTIFRILLILCLPFAALFSHARNANDLSVTLHENTLNKLLQAVGEIKGESSYEVLMVKGNYTWRLKNSSIKLINDSALFETDVKVETGLYTYRDHVKGQMSVTYNSKNNQIAITLTNAVFALKVNVLGNDIVLKKIQLAEYLSAPFTFEGPQTLSQEMEFPMPDGSRKLLSVKPAETSLKIIPGKIVVDSQLVFSEKTEVKK